VKRYQSFVLITLIAGANPLVAETPDAEIDALRDAVDQLREALAARDAVILDLLERIERLEGDEPAGQEPASDKAAATATLPSPPRPARSPVEAPAESAPGQVVVDERTTASAIERALVQQGALLLAPGDFQAEPSLVFARDERFAASAVETAEGTVIATDERRRSLTSAELALRAGLPFESQVTVRLPYRRIDEERVARVGFAGAGEDNAEASGFGDLALQASKVVWRERGFAPDAVVSLAWDTRTGGRDEGIELGSGFDELTGSLVVSKSQDPLVFVGELSYTQSFERNDIDPGDAVGLSAGTVLAASPETSLSFFLDQSFFRYTKIDGRNVPGSDDVATSLRLGASSVLSATTVLDVDVSIGLTEAAPDYVLGIALPVRF
jgi:hypothetical protein